MLNGVNNANLILVFIKMDFVQSKGWKKSYATQKFIHLHQKCIKWTASSKFGTHRICEQRRFRRSCASAQSRQNLRCSLLQAVNQAEPSDRKPDSWPLWMAGHAQLKFVMTECSKTQIRLTGRKWRNNVYPCKPQFCHIKVGFEGV